MVHMVVGIYGYTLHELRDIFKLFYISPKSINGLDNKQATNTKKLAFLRHHIEKTTSPNATHGTHGCRNIWKHLTWIERHL